MEQPKFKQEDIDATYLLPGEEGYTGEELPPYMYHFLQNEFFKKGGSDSIQELSDVVKEQEKLRGMPEGLLEKELMAYIGDMLGELVD